MHIMAKWVIYCYHLSKQHTISRASKGYACKLALSIIINFISKKDNIVIQDFIHLLNKLFIPVIVINMLI